MEQEMKQRKSTFNLMCYLKKSNTLKNGDSPIYLKITVNGVKAVISLQGSVSPTLWNQAKERTKSKENGKS